MLAIAAVGDCGAGTGQQQSGHSNRDDIGTRVGDDIAITLGSGTLHQAGNCLLESLTSCVDLLLRGVAVVGTSRAFFSAARRALAESSV